MNNITQNEVRRAYDMHYRTIRAGLFAVAAYAMLWAQSVYDGSYLLLSLSVFVLSLARYSLVLVQVLLGALFLTALTSNRLPDLVEMIAAAL